MPYFFVLLHALILLIYAPTAQAGTWTQIPNPGDDGCTLKYEGRIEGGDLTGAADRGLLEAWPTRICLNSEGGSLAEVYRFLRQMDATDGGFFATYIRRGDQCLSSCAVLFMFGQSVGANSPFPDRNMEPGARLGFHSPYIPPGRASGVDGSDAFRVALDVAKLLADRSYTATTVEGPALPTEILSLVLGTPADSMRYVESVGELYLLNISMTDDPSQTVRMPANRDAVVDAMKRICASTYVLTFREHWVEDGYAFEDLVTRAAQPSYYSDVKVESFAAGETYNDAERVVGIFSGPYYQPGWYSAGSALYCRVDLDYRRSGDVIDVVSFQVDFDFMNAVDMNNVPEYSERFRELPAGLVPIDTPYR